MNSNVSSSFSGPYAQGLINALQQEWSQPLNGVSRDGILIYWYNLSLDTAQPNELSFIGYLIGYPWPSAPALTFTGGNFTFGRAVDYPLTSTTLGFGSAVNYPNGPPGGFLGSVFPITGGNLIPQWAYAKMLKAIAYLKFNGLSLRTIDIATNMLWSSYYINQGYAPHDIKIDLSGGAAVSDAWMVQAVFDFFTTDPYIFIARV